ncbi:MAG: hypothetical protein U0103_17145 [Candidatus Obscuribacterales bacterium]
MLAACRCRGSAGVFPGKVQRLQVVSDPKSKNFGSLLLEGTDGNAEIQAVCTIDGSSIVVRYEQGVCRHRDGPVQMGK